MKKIAQDTAIFENFRKPNVVYVDKTSYLHRLVSDPEQGRFFFIARPRRFGKSLMISTLEAIFKGRKELFDGLAISKTDYDWQGYPVIHLSFAMLNVSTVEMAQEEICGKLADSLLLVGYDYDTSMGPGRNLRRAILQLHQQTGKQVVVLVDEYDAPIGDAFDDLQKANAIRAFLADIYGQIKENEDLIRFAMLTGVTRFTNLSIFSKLNTLGDLTLDPEFATMLGYTEEELKANFSEHMHAHAQKMKLSDEDYLAQLRFWYDGYRFTALNETRVYNPIAIAKTLIAQAPHFSATWATTGRPTIVAKFAKRQELPSLAEQANKIASLPDITSTSIENMKALSLLYQTGYLTIDQVRQGDEVTLRVPNEEVRRDYSGFILTLSLGEDGVQTMGENVREALAKHDFKELFSQLKSLYATFSLGAAKAKIPESFYQAILQTLFLSLNFQVTVNAPAAEGFADLVLETIDGTFIFELKRSYNGTVKDAIAQIRERHYAEPYIAKGRPIYLIGLVFDDQTHLLVDNDVETYASEG